MKFLYLTVFGLSALLVVLTADVINISIENDGLRQVAEGHKGSIRTLLKFIEATVKCELDPNAVAKQIESNIASRPPFEYELGSLAFRARFSKAKPVEVEVIDVDKTLLCAK